MKLSSTDELANTIYYLLWFNFSRNFIHG